MTRDEATDLLDKVEKFHRDGDGDGLADAETQILDAMVTPTESEADAALRALGEAMANQVLNENEPDAGNQRERLAAATFSAATAVRNMILRRVR